MGAFSLWHWIIILLVVIILFGSKGRISSIMGDIGKGFKKLKQELKEGDDNDKKDK